MYTPLSASNFGTVYYCRKNHYIRIDFSERPMVLSYNDFVKLKESVAQYLRVNKGIEDKDALLIRLLTMADAMMLIYSYNDLRRLIVILNAAYEKLNNDMVFITQQTQRA